MRSRLENTILGQQAFGRGANAPMVDPTLGGQMGYAPNLEAWVSNAAYVRRNLIPILVEAPRGFQYLPEPQKWIDCLRVIMEEHPVSIDGLNAGLEIQTTENPIGGSGQVQHEFVNVKEVQSNPQFRWVEKYGMAISTFWRHYVTYLMMDPSSKVAGISTLPNGRSIPDMLPDMYTFTMAFVEPDPHHNKVVKSWLVTNMFPHGGIGDIVGRREITSDLETMPIDISFGGIAQFGTGVNATCQQLLDAINITGASPMNRQAFVQEIESDIARVRGGYQTSAERVGEQNVNL